MSDKHGNEAFAWDNFDPEAYVAHYYADPHPDDDRVVACVCRALSQLPASSDVVDVGTGPNLFPLLAALPVAKRLTVWEYGERNIAWMRRELQRNQLREPWAHFWEVASAVHGASAAAIANPARELAKRTEVVQGSIFDLPERRWGAATMFFCAESITQRQDEFERACAAFGRCVGGGGLIAAAFLAGSRGYRVGDADYPAVSVDEAVLRRAFAGVARDVEITPIGAMGEEIRSGYSGMIFLAARAI